MQNVIGFFGGDSQVGTTMISWAFAERLAEKGKRVLLIFGSGSDDCCFLSADGGRSVDHLKAAIRSGKLEREDLLQNLEKQKQLWVLPGTKNSMTTGGFLENTFQIMLENVKGDFDYVVIDGGSDVRLGLTISALHVCHHRYFILTQQAKTLHRYIQCQRQLLTPLGFEHQIIINKYRKNPAFVLKKDVCKMTDIEAAIVIPYVEAGWHTELDGKNLLSFAGFCKAIDNLVLTFVPDLKKEGKWKKLFI